MHLSLYCRKDGLLVRSRKTRRAFQISYLSGAVSAVESVWEPGDTDEAVLEIACIIGISRFPNAGHGYLVVAMELQEVARLPPEWDPVYRIDRVLLVPIHKELGPFVVQKELARKLQLETSEDDSDDETSSTDDDVLCSNVDYKFQRTKADRGFMRRLLLRQTTLPRWPLSLHQPSERPISHRSQSTEATAKGLSMSLANKFDQSVRRIFAGQTYFSKHKSFQRSKFNFNKFLAQEVPEAFRIAAVEGFVGTASLPIKARLSLEIILVSMRSNFRNGLRYQRRGIDHSGNVANFVETSQLTWLSSDRCSVATFTQIRGSIPLFWTQSSSALRPVPILTNSNETTNVAIRRHYEDLEKDYGSVVSLNLVNQDGREAIVGQKFSSALKDIDRSILNWDFHKETLGMKYEQISSLMATLAPTLLANHWSSDSASHSVDQKNARQSGIIRTNCMDCLDRTNVVQSTIASHLLKTQYFADTSSTIEPVLTWSPECQDRFRNLWADNGDAIAMQYTRSPALKGDYTRTGKREFRGLLNDAKNSVRRYYSNFIADYFDQLVLDHVLGHADDGAVNKFEATLSPCEHEGDVTKMLLREEALKVTQETLLDSADVENTTACLGAWTLLTPSHKGDLTSELMECQLLITDESLYLGQFDYCTGSTTELEKITLAKIKEIRHGAFITSIVHPYLTDPVGNYGLAIVYEDETVVKLRVFKSDYTGEVITQRAFVQEIVRELEAAINKPGMSASRHVQIRNQVIFDVSRQSRIRSMIDILGYQIRTMIWS